MVSARVFVSSFGRAVSSLMVVACVASCGKSTPASPSAAPAPQQSAPATPRLITIAGFDVYQRTLSLALTTSSGAQRYIVEVGSSAGGADVATFTVDAPAASVQGFVTTWQDVPVGPRLYIRVRAANAAGNSESSNEVGFEMPDFRNIIEALFFASGPFSEGSFFPGGGTRNHARTMLGWTPGARVSVRVPHEVVAPQFDAIVRTVGDLNTAIGANNFFIERVTLTRNQWNQLRPAGISILVEQGVCVRADGTSADCASSTPVPVFATSLISMGSATQPLRTWAHELGHSVGLQHMFFKVWINDHNVNLDSVFRDYVPIMGSARVELPSGTYGIASIPADYFGVLELEAVRRVYAAGLRPGSSLADFVARGLIAP